MSNFALIRRLPRKVFARFPPSVRFAPTAKGTRERLPELPLPTFLPVGHPKEAERIFFFEDRVEGARKPRDRLTYEKAKFRRERSFLEGKLQCSKCELFKTIDLFYVDSRAKHSRRSYCKLCSDEITQYYSGFTLRGVMISVLRSSKGNSLKRSENPLRKEAGQFSLDFDTLLNLWQTQKGRCAYSGIVMNIERGTHWRLSLERCDNTRGYVPGNVAFVCAEFNTPDHSLNAKHGVRGSSRWTKDKVLSLPERVLSAIPLSDSSIHELVSTMRTFEKRKQHLKQQIAADGNLLCTLCGKFKSVEHFYPHRQTSSGRRCFCKLCDSARARGNITSFGGFLRMRVRGAKSNAKKRIQKGREGAGVFDLTINDVVNIYKRQRGLCYYTGIKMLLEPCIEWMCSIERLDNKRGYVVDNVVLICAEFQTSDYSGKAKFPVHGSAQWSKEKVKMLARWLRSNRVLLNEA